MEEGYLMPTIHFIRPGFLLLLIPLIAVLFFVLKSRRQMNATDLKPNRLTRAKYKILDLLKQQNEGQTGMLVFSSKPFVVSPLTQDAATIAAMVPMLDLNILPVQGEDIGAGLRKAAEMIKQ